jgi:exodeoxyribonuclease VII small subunit
MAAKQAGARRRGPGDEPPDEPGFDQRLARLEAIVAELEDGELGLEGAIARYREGVDLLRGCREQLAGFRRQVEELSGLAEQALRPYEDDPDVEQQA